MTEECENEIIKAGGGSREEARAMLQAIDDRAARIRRLFGADPKAAMSQAAAELSAEEKLAQAIERRNRVLNLNTRIARRQAILDTALVARHRGEPDLVHAIQNQETARNLPTQGNRASAEAEWTMLATEYTGALATQLDKGGLLAAFRDPAMAKTWGLELHELSRQAAGDAQANPGVTGSKTGLAVARVVHGIQTLAKERANRAGAWIGDYAGWITTTQHDSLKMARAGFASWRNTIAPLLDEKTFEGIKDHDGFLHDTYNALVSGVHLKDTERVGLKDPAFTGPGNLAKRVSGERVLHFQDGTAWMQYQEKFGRGALNEQVTQTLERSARATALLRHFGTNPLAELQDDITWLKQHFRDSAPTAVARLGANDRAIAIRMDYLTGAANIPGNLTAAQISAGIRAVQSMAKLGGVMFTHLSVLSTKASELRYHGVPFLARWGNTIDSIMQGRGRGEQRELSDLLLAGVEGTHGYMLSRFNADDAPSGRVAKFTNRFFQLSGLTWMLDAQKAGAARVMSRFVGQHVGKDFDTLPAELQRTLASYNVTRPEWEALRGVDHFQVDGRAHVVPDAAHAIPDAAIAAMRPPRPDKARPLTDATLAEIDTRIRDNIYLKLRMMYLDIADRAIIRPGIEEKALMLGGTRPGTMVGEALRFMAQFKSWGTAAVRQGIGRELYGGQSNWGKASGMFQMAVGTVVAGYITQTLKSLFKGLTPRDPSDPRTLFAAAMQGGGFGILGDYAFGQFSRFGQSPVETLAGPTAGTAAELLQLLALGRGLATGDPQARARDAGPEALRIAQNNTPFINLFWTRRALDYLLFHSIQESMNPGYLRRAERTMQRNTGQQYLSWPIDMHPSNHLHSTGR